MIATRSQLPDGVTAVPVVVYPSVLQEPAGSDGGTTMHLARSDDIHRTGFVGFGSQRFAMRNTWQARISGFNFSTRPLPRCMRFHKGNITDPRKTLGRRRSSVKWNPTIGGGVWRRGFSAGDIFYVSTQYNGCVREMVQPACYRERICHTLVQHIIVRIFACRIICRVKPEGQGGANILCA